MDSFCRFNILQRVHYGTWEDLNDLAMNLMIRYNRTLAQGDVCRLDLLDSYRILLVWLYWYSVRYFSGAGVHDGHRAALAYSFLDVARWFGGVFRRPPFNLKGRQRYDDGLARQSARNDKTGMEYLLGVEGGVQGRHFMASDLLGTMFTSVARQERPVGNYWRPRNATTRAKWEESVAKTWVETVNRIAPHMGTQTKRDGRVYPAPLRYAPRNYIDYAFPFYTDPSVFGIDEQPPAPAAAGDAGPQELCPEGILPVRSGGWSTMTAAQVAACADEDDDDEESAALQSALRQEVVFEQDSPEEEDEDAGAISTDTDMAGVAQGLTLNTPPTTYTPLPNLQAHMAEHGGGGDQGDVRPKRQGEEESEPRKRSRSRDKATEVPPCDAGALIPAKPEEEVIVLDGQDSTQEPMTWLPAKGAYFPVHKAIDDAPAFVYWASCLNMDHLSVEVRSLRYLPNHEEAARDLIGVILWALVKNLQTGQHPYPDCIPRRLTSYCGGAQSPSHAPYPVEPEYNLDIRYKCREVWEYLFAWVQYWWEAQIHRTQQQIFFGGRCRTDSRMVLFGVSHLNELLPADLAIRLDVIMDNTGWNAARKYMREHQPDVVDFYDHKEQEAAARTDREKMRIRQKEKQNAHANCRALRKLVQAARQARSEAQRKAEAARAAAERRDMEKRRRQGFPPELEADLQKVKAAQRAADTRPGRSGREPRGIVSSGSTVRSKSGRRTNLERIGDKRRDEKERERNRQSRRDSGSRDATGPTFQPPRPIDQATTQERETLPSGQDPPTEQGSLGEDTPAQQDPPATNTPPRRVEEPMVMSPPRGTPRPPPGLPAPEAEQAAAPLTGPAGPTALEVSINLKDIGLNPEEEFGGGVYDPIDKFREEYFATPQVPFESAGGLSDPNYWGRHDITNREDRRSLNIPGKPEEYHPVPSPERRQRPAGEDVLEKSAPPTGEVSPDTERRLLDEALGAGIPADQSTDQPEASAAEEPATTADEPSTQAKEADEG